MYYFYILKSGLDGDLYFGYSSDLKRRVGEHNKGWVKSTKDRRPLKPVYYEAYLSESDARNRELQIKRRAKALSGLKRRIKNSLTV